jgi:hypothetical protein
LPCSSKTITRVSNGINPKFKGVFMKKSIFAFALVGMFALSGCYHAKVSTGLPASAEVIDIPFAHSFVGGLVPPNEVRVATRCTNGVSMIETKISFINGLVASLTFSLYTPIHITVTCAAASSASLPVESKFVTVSENATDVELADAFNKAAEMSVENSTPVYFVYE